MPQNELYDTTTTYGGIGSVLSGEESFKVEHSIAPPWEVFGAFAIVSLLLIIARYTFQVK